jgi:ATP-dependent DNA helicase DinG
VEQAYDALGRDPQFSARPAQKEFSHAVVHALLEERTLVAQAPTGTGKTIAYLVGALACVRAGVDFPVMVSTATKALQAQLVAKDLPRLEAAGLVRPHEAALVKGRSNYFCTRDAQAALKLLEEGALDPEVFVRDALLGLEPKTLRHMLAQYASQAWDGDFDSWAHSRPKSVAPIAANRDTCSAKKCAHYRECAFFKSREEMLEKRLLVGNHDLVLRDLAAAKLDASTLPVGHYYVVFDEAHHLPDKAVAVGAKALDVGQLERALPALLGMQRLVAEHPRIGALLHAQGLSRASFDPQPAEDALQALRQELEELDIDDGTAQLRFPQGEVGAKLRAALAALEYPALQKLHANLDHAQRLLKDATLEGPAAGAAEELSARALDLLVLLREALPCVQQLIQPNPRVVKWLLRHEQVLRLHTSPLEGADVLREVLWSNSRAKASVLTSATLRDADGFDRFAARAGVPGGADLVTLPYVFDYARSQLVIAGMRSTPKPDQRAQFVAELRLKLAEKIDPAEGSLVLFPSWSLLRELAPALKRALGARRIKMQGDEVLAVLLRQHKQDIDAGQGSVLAGVATLAEGLDLPGAYCTHVLIAALPFASPAEPVEQELAQLLGAQYFAQRSLPDATQRLIQMAGRLLRRECDQGRITVFDRRLANTGYGRKMLASLPPFTVTVEPAQPAAPAAALAA